MNNYNNEREIDLLDLLAYLFRKWVWFVIAIVIGAVIAGGYAVVRNSIVNSHQEQIGDVATEVDIPLFTDFEKIKVKSYFENISIIEQSEEIAKRTTDDSVKMEAIRTISECYERISNLGLTEDQIKKINTFDNSNQSVEEFLTTTTTTTTITYSLIKYVGVGAVVGIFVIGILLCIAYVFSDSIHTANDVRLFAVPVIADLRNNYVKTKGIERVACKLTGESVIPYDERVKVLKSTLVNMGGKDIVLTGTVSKYVLDDVAKVINSTDTINAVIEVKSVANPVEVAASVLELAGKNVIIVEKIECSKFSDVERLMECMKLNHYEVGGAIIL